MPNDPKARRLRERLENLNKMIAAAKDIYDSDGDGKKLARTLLRLIELKESFTSYFPDVWGRTFQYWYLQFSLLDDMLALAQAAAVKDDKQAALDALTAAKKKKESIEAAVGQYLNG